MKPYKNFEIHITNQLPGGTTTNFIYYTENRKTAEKMMNNKIMSGGSAVIYEYERLSIKRYKADKIIKEVLL